MRDDNSSSDLKFIYVGFILLQRYKIEQNYENYNTQLKGIYKDLIISQLNRTSFNPLNVMPSEKYIEIKCEVKNENIVRKVKKILFDITF